MFPYKRTRVHQSQPQDSAKQVAFSQFCIENASSNSEILRQTISSSDKVAFDFSGLANSQTTPILGEKPQKVFKS